MENSLLVLYLGKLCMNTFFHCLQQLGMRYKKYLSKTFCIGLEPVETSSLNLGDSFTYPQNVCGPSRSQENGICSGLQKVVEAQPRRSRGVADFQAFLKPYFSTFMVMFKLAQKRRFWPYELAPNMFWVFFEQQNTPRSFSETFKPLQTYISRSEVRS